MWENDLQTVATEAAYRRERLLRDYGHGQRRRPGIPGMDRSPQDRVQLTVTRTDAGVPAGAA